MIAEYALEPELVATWGNRMNHRYYIREFGRHRGRLASRYPKKWAKKVWEAFAGGSDLEEKRLTELLVQLQQTMIKRKDYSWDENISWLENALLEHGRYPFRAILAHHNPDHSQAVLTEENLNIHPNQLWDIPHGIVINKIASDMAKSIKEMLSCCRWIKFIDPYMSPLQSKYSHTLIECIKLLSCSRSVGRIESVELHTSERAQLANNIDYLIDTFGKSLPPGMQVCLFEWKEIENSDALHNRYVLTDLGGVSFAYGLGAGKLGQTDDVLRLDEEQYNFKCLQYSEISNFFTLIAKHVIHKDC